MPKASNRNIKRIQIEKNKLLIQEVASVTADEVVDIIAESIPGINIPYKLAKAYFGHGMKLRQARVLEFIEFIRDNLGVFSQKLFNNEQFQDCFVLLLESFIKERAETKRNIYKRMLLGAAKINSKELEKFELERLIFVTSQISIKALSVVKFIKTKLLDLIDKDIEKELNNFQDREGVEGIRLAEITKNRIIVSEYLSKWIYENYNINSQKLKNKFGYENSPEKSLWHKLSYKEHCKEKELLGPLPELANLGIMIKKEGTPTFGGTVGSGYSLSDFGYQFLEFIGK